MLKAIFKNSFAGILAQIVSVVFAFLTRTFFIQYFGVELLGINSTFSSILSTLSLAELGVQSAIVYALYKPIMEEDSIKINDIMNILKIIYRGIGIVFIAVSIGILPILKYILKGVTMSSEIGIFFLIQMLASSASYFFSYKRALIYADQRDYISKYIDLLFNVVFNTVQILALIKFKNYYMFLIIKVVQVFLSNITISIMCNRYYPYLHRSQINKPILKDIIKNVKNIFSGKIAAYVYSSTDNLVISAMISTVTVGYFVNYTTVTSSIKMIGNSLLAPLQPIIGNYLARTENIRDQENSFLKFTYVRFILAVLLLVPTIVLIDDFIIMWIGEEFLLSQTISLLIGMDLFIHFVHSSTCEYMYGKGIFAPDKYIGLAGAVTNIVTSIVLAIFMGISGVLIGTVISQMLFWILRSYIVYKKCFDMPKSNYFKYWIKCLAYIIAFIGILFVSAYVVDFINISILPISFIIKGIVIEGISILLIFGLFFFTRENKEINNYILSKIKIKKA